MKTAFRALATIVIATSMLFAAPAAADPPDPDPSNWMPGDLIDVNGVILEVDDTYPDIDFLSIGEMVQGIPVRIDIALRETDSGTYNAEVVVMVEPRVHNAPIPNRIQVAYAYITPLAPHPAPGGADQHAQALFTTSALIEVQNETWQLAFDLMEVANQFVDGDPGTTEPTGPSSDLWDLGANGGSGGGGTPFEAPGPGHDDIGSGVPTPGDINHGEVVYTAPKEARRGRV